MHTQVLCGGPIFTFLFVNIILLADYSKHYHKRHYSQ